MIDRIGGDKVPERVVHPHDSTCTEEFDGTRMQHFQT